MLTHQLDKDCRENMIENSWVMRNAWDVTMKGKDVINMMMIA